jgi:hypothetical protein
LERTARESIRQKQIRNYPLPFIATMMGGMAETTMAFIAQNKKTRTDLCAAGFDVFWNGITNE